MNKFKHLLILSFSLPLFFSCNDAKTDKTEPSPASAPATGLKEQNLNYQSDAVNFGGYLVYPADSTVKHPGILVIPEWWGLNDYAKMRARKLAELGYVAMAVDMYGDSKTAANPEEATKLSTPFYSDEMLGKARIEAALSQLKSAPGIDTAKLGAIGYCFGGAMVLNAAKMGSDLDGVVSFHGTLNGPAPKKELLHAQVLVCHGAADEFVSPADSATFRKQMDSVGATYSFKTYQGAQHAFTNPKADDYHRDFKIPVGYNAAADSSSWNDMKAFFERVFK